MLGNYKGGNTSPLRQVKRSFSRVKIHLKRTKIHMIILEITFIFNFFRSILEMHPLEENSDDCWFKICW